MLSLLLHACPAAAALHRQLAWCSSSGKGRYTRSQGAHTSSQQNTAGAGFAIAVQRCQMHQQAAHTDGEVRAACRRQHLQPTRVSGMATEYLRRSTAQQVPGNLRTVTQACLHTFAAAGPALSG